ncbi:Acetyl esterase [Rhizobium rhizogenes]|uniref:Acetyl esterase n=1 Tax=Rhizobium rhizogenes TaxID=359 RepID=A0AAN2A894_RHIRH|nr:MULTISPECIES: alpha/beta hydrolase [Rhizobium/Agrobacterium group]AQS65171.1 alpha/beta hydrolase [Rhizobium rhizogenes]MBO0129047.1 alpha/beta hydrolase [Agrobacterium sp. OT33]MCZ7445858.1 alpha/beta hydrolase [Rhizobium rhizogenes]NSZ81957.1 alpha/beta hydrolase [Agrobacterium tumefaciens]OAM63067.1 lipase [Rhizobium rhizogenes]
MVRDAVFPPVIRQDVQNFLDNANSIPGPKLYEMEPQEARARFLEDIRLTDLPIEKLPVIRDLAIPAAAGFIPARIYDRREQKREDPTPTVVFFHGGGFVIGNLDSHAGFCAEMARSLDLPVVAIDYRLAPEAKWPAAPDDCEVAARWVAESPAALGFDVSGLILVGDSAGGNLAIVSALALRDRPAKVPVLIQAPIYPATDISRPYPSAREFAEGFLLTAPMLDWFITCYGADAQDHRTSPVLADLDGLPSAIVVTAGLDPLRDQGRAYATALAEAGVDVWFHEAEGNVHGFVALRQAIPSATADVAWILTMLRTEIHRIAAQNLPADIR